MSENEKPSFWSLVQDSLIFQGTLTIGITGAWLYMMIAGLSIPPELHAAAGIVMGFFFGSKQSVFARSEAKKMEAQRRLLEETRKNGGC